MRKLHAQASAAAAAAIDKVDQIDLVDKMDIHHRLIPLGSGGRLGKS